MKVNFFNETNENIKEYEKVIKSIFKDINLKKEFNIIFVTKDGSVITPKSDSILPSITRRSLMVVARDYLGLNAEERVISKDELDSFLECGLCGTAAVISPVGKIVVH